MPSTPGTLHQPQAISKPWSDAPAADDTIDPATSCEMDQLRSSSQPRGFSTSDLEDSALLIASTAPPRSDSDLTSPPVTDRTSSVSDAVNDKITCTSHRDESHSRISDATRPSSEHEQHSFAVNGDRHPNLSDEGTTANAYTEASESSNLLSVPATVADDHINSITSATSSNTGNDKESNIEHLNTAQEYWNPIWLRKGTLLALVALFGSLAIALVVLYFVNKAQQGFPITLSSNHYAWTYGPTAVLVIVISFWRQVEYHCKMIQPWQVLRNGPADAAQSVLLDYLSPLQVVSLAKAIRFRHTAVAASITGFLVLKIVVLISTGLLVLTPVTITEQRDIILTTAFNSSYFWDTLPDEEYILSNKIDGAVVYPNLSSHPVHSYLNTLTDESSGNLASNEVFQTMEPFSEPGLENISTKVFSFTPNISCEIVDPLAFGSGAWLNKSSCVGTENIYFDLEKPLCKDPCSSVISYNLWKINCSEEATLAYTQESVLDVDTPYDFRFAMLVSNLTFEIVIDNSTDTDAKNESGYLPSLPISHQSAAVICKIDYSMHESAITRHFSDNTTSVNDIGPLRNITGLSGTMLGHIVYSALARAQNVVGDLKRLSEPDDDAAPSPLAPFYAIMLQTLEGRRSLDRFLSAETLQSSASRVWAGIASHFMREFLLQPVRHEIPGTAVFVQDRLLIGDASLWIMVAGFVLLAILTLCIMTSMHANAVPLDPGLLSSDAVILASSTSLHRLLKDCNDLRTSEISAMLRGTRFQTDDRGTIQVTAVADTTIAETERPESHTKAWAPFCAKRSIICLTLAIPLTAIVLLEVLYHVSETKHGLIDVSGSEPTATYLSRYLSALVALLAATCFNALDFTTSSFAPYSNLQLGNVPASRGINLQILGALPIIALSRSIRNRHAGSLFTNLAGMIGSTLTIIASGLWVVDHEAVSGRSVTAALTSTWDIEWKNSSSTGDGGAAVIFDQIQHGSAIAPTGIWNKTGLPDIANIQFATNSTAFDDTKGPSTYNFTFPLVGLRPLLSCEVLADANVRIESDEHDKEMMPFSAIAILPLSGECQWRYANGTPEEFWLVSSRFRPGFVGDLFNFHLGPVPVNYTAYEYGEPYINLREKEDSKHGCPSIGVIFGKQDGYRTQPDDITALMCSQKMQQVQLDVTYIGSDMQNPKINPDVAPVFSKDPAVNLTNGTDGIDSFPWRVMTYLRNAEFGDGNLTKIWTNEQFGPADDEPEEEFDNFMQLVTEGENGYAAETLWGKANRANLTEAVSDLYAQYMALVIDMRFRKPIARDTSADESQNLVHGTAYSFSSRLRLNFASKLTMQVMLGTMLILGALTYSLTNLRSTLPRKPYSIASRLALFASSDLCDERKALLPHNAMWMSQQELNQIFDIWFFSLGWWEEAESHSNDPSRETSSSNRAASPTVKRQRFGIDVGFPEQLGFYRTKS